MPAISNLPPVVEPVPADALAAVVQDGETRQAEISQLVAATGANLDVGNRTATTLDVTNTNGTDATIPPATADLAGLMTEAQFDKLDGIEDGATAEVSATTTVEGIVELATQAEVDAGTDPARVVTPATLSSYPFPGGGDVTGPGSAVDDSVALYDGTTGKLLKDSSATVTGANLDTLTNGGDASALHTHPGAGTGDVVGPASSTNAAVCTFDGTTGKLIQDSAVLLTALATDADLTAHTGATTSVHGIADTSALLTAVVQDTSPQLGGTLDAVTNSIENLGAVEEEVNTVAVSGATEALDVSAFGVHDVTMDQNCTFTFSNPAPSGDASAFVLILRGAFTPTFPASVNWPDATPPDYTTPTVFVFTTVDAGTTWLGSSPGKAFA